MHKLLAVFLGVLVLATPSWGVDQAVVRLATSSSLKASGLLDVLIPAFEKATGYRLEAYTVGSGRALRMGRLGEVDVVIAHAEEEELKYVAAGHSESRIPLMENSFVLVGPAHDPAGVKGATSIADSFGKIAASRSTFVSRADDSGNHRKELAVWTAAEVEPLGEWYFETGMAMLPSLQKANELNAYLLIDSGSWLKNRKQSALMVMVDGDPVLANSYSLIATSTRKHPSINHEGKNRFVKWILSPEGKQLIGSIKIDGERLYKLTAP